MGDTRSISPSRSFSHYRLTETEIPRKPKSPLLSTSGTLTFLSCPTRHPCVTPYGRIRPSISFRNDKYPLLSHTLPGLCSISLTSRITHYESPSTLPLSVCREPSTSDNIRAQPYGFFDNFLKFCPPLVQTVKFLS